MELLLYFRFLNTFPPTFKNEMDFIHYNYAEEPLLAYMTVQTKWSFKISLLNKVRSKCLSTLILFLNPNHNML